MPERFSSLCSKKWGFIFRLALSSIFLRSLISCALVEGRREAWPDLERQLQISPKWLFCQSLSDVPVDSLLRTNWSCRIFKKKSEKSEKSLVWPAATLPWSEKAVWDLADELAVCLGLFRSEKMSQRWRGGGGTEMRNREWAQFGNQDLLPNRERKMEEDLLWLVLTRATVTRNGGAVPPGPAAFFVSFHTNTGSANINLTLELWESGSRETVLASVKAPIIHSHSQADQTDEALTF